MNDKPNGRIALIQTITRSVVAIIAVGSSVFLLARGIEIPNQFWLIDGAAIVGVYGAESFTIILDYFKTKGR